MKIKANAKVNLSLDVLEKRPDGCHELCSVMQSVSLCDIVTVEQYESIEIKCSDEQLNGKDNLCYKAAESFFDAAKISGGCLVYIEKHIPKAGGLGGGSADAAAVLYALNQLNGRPLSDTCLLDLALTLGADVPFCLVGGTKLCEGIGEKMTVLPLLPSCLFLIVKKGQKSSTGEMYRALDKAKSLRRPKIEKIIQGLYNGELSTVFDGCFNCFEQVCDTVALNEVKSIAYKNGAKYCGFSGAGPSIISVFDNESEANLVAGELEGIGFETFVVSPTETALEII